MPTATAITAWSRVNKLMISAPHSTNTKQAKAVLAKVST